MKQPSEETIKQLLKLTRPHAEKLAKEKMKVTVIEGEHTDENIQKAYGILAKHIRKNGHAD